MHGKMQRIFFRFLTLCTLLPALPAFSQTAGTSVELYSFFIGRGYKTDYQGLSPSQSDIYPRNILISLPASQAAPDQTGTQAGNTGSSPASGRNSESPQAAGPGKRLENIILIFQQRDVAESRERFLEFTEELTELSLPFSITLLLAANEEAMRIPVTDEAFEHPKGIRVFAGNLENGENSCAIICKKALRNRISAGSGGEVSPIWLVRALKESCAENGISVRLPNSASFLYRLGLISEDESLAPFLSDSIPAAGLSLKAGEDFGTSLLTALQKLARTNTGSWDSHYSFVSILSLEFWLDETFFLLCYIATAFAVLLRLCFSTVRQTERNKAIIKDLSQSWYLIIVLLAFTLGILQLSQKIPGLNSPFIAATLGERIAIVIAASLLFFTVLSKLKIIISSESVSRIMLFMAACNIFIFCAQDISFLFLFLSEYVTCLIARRAKRKLPIIVSLILMFIPFIPHAVNILMSANPWALARLSNPGLTGNLITALIIFPFQLQFLRLMMQMEFFVRRKRSFVLVRLLSMLLFIGACVCLFACSYFFVVRTMLFANLPARDEQQPMLRPEMLRPSFSEEGDEDYILASYSTDDFMEYKFTNVIVAPAEGVSVLRYDICLETESGIPLNDCNYGYSLSGRHKAYIEIPDNPSSALDIVFTCERDVIPVAFITSYLQNADGKLFIERDSLNMVSGGKGGESGGPAGSSVSTRGSTENTGGSAP